MRRMLKGYVGFERLIVSSKETCAAISKQKTEAVGMIIIATEPVSRSPAAGRVTSAG